jgi:hypothetical protein
MDKLEKLYKHLKNSDKKILFLTTSNRWEGEKSIPKSSMIAHELAKKLKSVEIINVSKLKIFPCEGNVSNVLLKREESLRLLDEWIASN